MNLSEIVSITNMPGLWQIVKKRTDGMIVKSLLDDKTTFVSQRQNMFTPLENITMYTNDEPLELKAILLQMKKVSKTNPPAEVKADGATLRAYFEKIVPNYDQERVYTSDIVKLIKWYHLLNGKNLIVEDEPVAETKKKEVAAESAVEATEEVKKKKKKTKKAEPAEEASEAAEVKPKAKTTKKAE